MTKRKSGGAILLSASLLLAGCVGSGNPGSQIWSGWSESTAPMRVSWQRLTSQRRCSEPPVWDWAAGLPAGAPRAQMFTAMAPAQAVAQFIPQVTQSPIMLASVGGGVRPLPEGFVIRNIGGRPIHNVGDMYRALDEATAHGGRVQVDVLPSGQVGEGEERACEVDLPTLVALCHSVVEHEQVLSTVGDGNPWLIVRSGGVRANLLVRREKNHDLVQVVLSLTNCWDPEQTLPVELRVAADGVPLRCLTAAETLEALYGRGLPDAKTLDPASYSFAAVSERDDYRIPVNYKNLDERMAGVRQAMRPALASLGGAPYPGPAVLGDARAVSAFLLQRQPLGRGEGEHTGWAIFGGSGVRKVRQLDVTLDLGGGPRSFRFLFPQES